MLKSLIDILVVLEQGMNPAENNFGLKEIY